MTEVSIERTRDQDCATDCDPDVLDETPDEERSATTCKQCLPSWRAGWIVVQRVVCTADRSAVAAKCANYWKMRRRCCPALRFPLSRFSYPRQLNALTTGTCGGDVVQCFGPALSRFHYLSVPLHAGAREGGWRQGGLDGGGWLGGR